MAVRAALRGRDAEEVELVGERYAKKVADNWLRSDTPQRLAWHTQQGHTVVLVSASLGPYLRPLGRMLGVDDVLCTDVVIGDDGKYTGSLDGANCRGPEKIRRLRTWLASRNLDNAELWAYGDSAGDRELLAAAHHHFLVKDVVVSAEPTA